MGWEWIGYEDDSVRLEVELVDAAPTRDGPNRIVGRITRCGEPAVGIRIVAIEEVTIGIETEFKPCFKTTGTRQLGSATTASDGSYAVSYTAAPGPLDSCAYSARVRVDVYDDGVLLHRSPERIEETTVRFDLELFPGCASGETAVIVIDGSGRTVEGAEVFVNAQLAGTTNEQGTLISSLSEDDLLVARLLLEEHGTDRGGHTTGTSDGWSHRTYISSLRVRHGANGDDVELRQHVVVDPTTEQTLQLSTRNVLVGLNVVASIEWDATAEDIRRYTDRLREMSELLYNATDGQFLVEQVSVYDDGRYWDDADVRIYANLNQPSKASVAASFSSDGNIRMNPNDAHEPAVTLHELGHYAFGVYDEYKAGFLAMFFEGPHICSRASDGEGDFGAGGSKDSCLMRGARNAELKKICSTHPANPHWITTAQGIQDCWSEMLDRYGDDRWRLQTPAGRGVIVDLLPDSGVPLSTTTNPPPGVGEVASYIPVAGWKPIRRTSSVVRTGECPNQLVRAVLDGSPVNDVKIWLESGSRTIYQGVTNPYEQAYGETNGDGEIRLRGAHVGDRVRGLRWNFSVAYGEVEISDCGDEALVLQLNGAAFSYVPRFEPTAPGEIRVVVEAVERTATMADVRLTVDGIARPLSMVLPRAADPTEATVAGRLVRLPDTGRVDLEIVTVDAEGNQVVARTSAAFASAREEETVRVSSADGGLELVLPVGALPTPAQVVVETPVARLPAPPDGFRFIGDVYRVASSQGDRLAQPGWLSIELDVDSSGRLRTGLEVQEPEIVRLTDGRERWVPIEGREVGWRYVAGRTDRLSTFALVDRKQTAPRESSITRTPTA